MALQAKAPPALALIGIKGIDEQLLEGARLGNSRRDQLQDHAADPDPDVSELARADLFKEFGIWKRAEDNHEEDLHSE